MLAIEDHFLRRYGKTSNFLSLLEKNLNFRRLIYGEFLFDEARFFERSRRRFDARAANALACLSCKLKILLSR